MDVGIKAVDERSKNFNSIKEEPKKRCLLAPFSPLPFSPFSLLLARVLYEWTKEREIETSSPPPLLLKNCLDEIPSPRYTPPRFASHHQSSI